MTADIKPDNTRGWTRQQRGEAFRSVVRPHLVSEDHGDDVHWHEVDQPISADQTEELPASLEGGTKTGLVWVKFAFSHGGTPNASHGRYDYGTNQFTAQVVPKRFGGAEETVEVVAWTHIRKAWWPSCEVIPEA